MTAIEESWIAHIHVSQLSMKRRNNRVQTSRIDNLNLHYHCFKHLQLQLQLQTVATADFCFVT